MCITRRQNGSLNSLSASEADDLLTKLQSVPWHSILKALPFDGGPSSTRWVYIGVFTVISTGMLALDAALVWAVLHHRPLDIPLLTYSAGIKTALIGFGSGTQKALHQAQAAADADQPSSPTV